MDSIGTHPRTTARTGVSAAWCSGGWPTLIGLAGFAVTLMVTGRLLVVDALMNLYAGRWITEHGLPSTDHLTVAGHGRRWVDQQWLAHVVLFRLDHAFGWWAPAILCAVAVGAALAMLAAILLERGVPAGLALAWPTVAYFVAVANTTVRAQTLCYPLFVAVLWIVLSDRRRGRPAAVSLLALPVLVLWANLHGSVLIGAGVVALVSLIGGPCALRAGDRRGAARFLALAAAALAMVFVTPYSPVQVISYYRSVIGNPLIPRIVSEWQAPTLLGAWPFFLLCAASVVVVALTLWKRALPPPALVAIAAILAVAGSTADRYVVWFALAGSLVLGLGVSGLLSGHTSAAERRPLALDRVVRRLGMAAIAAGIVLPPLVPGRSGQLTALVFGGLILVAQAGSHRRAAGPGRLVVFAAAGAAAMSVAVTISTPATSVYSGVSMPAMDAAARFAAGHPGALLLADSSSAPALLWLHPDLTGRVGFDIRYEIYSQPALRRYARFITGYRRPGWVQTLRGYSVLVVSRGYPGLARAVAHLRGWRVIEADPAGLAVVRVSATG